MACCSAVSVKSSGIGGRLKVLGRSFRQDLLALLVDSAQCELAGPGVLGRKRHGVSRLDHPRKPAVDPAQASCAAGGLSSDACQQSHLQHPVSDDTRQADRPREIAVEMDRVVVARGLRVLRDLIHAESDHALDSLHERITKRVRDRQIFEPPAPVVCASKVRKRMPRRLMSETTWPCDVTVSPSWGCRSHSNSWSACKSFAKSTCASGSPKR